MASVEHFHEAIRSGLPLIGSPIKQVKTPPFVNARLRDLGSDLTMIAVEIASNQVSPFFDALRGCEKARGCSSTIPYKRQVFGQMDATSSEAARLKVVNTVRRDRSGALVGCMTDGTAMLDSLRLKGVDPHDSVALVVGAGGGAGRAIADALASAKAARVDLIDPNVDQLCLTFEALTASFRRTVFRQGDVSGPWDIIINASPLGSNETDCLPALAEDISMSTAIGDAVTTREVTDFVSTAREHGVIAVTGHEMARAQIDLQMRHWEVEI